MAFGLAERCRAWPADRVEAVTGIPAAQVEAAAKMIADNLPLSFFTCTGTCQHNSATQTGRAIAALYGLTGCLDAPGGNVWFSKPPLADVMGLKWVTQEERALTLGRDVRQSAGRWRMLRSGGWVQQPAQGSLPSSGMP